MKRIRNSLNTILQLLTIRKYKLPWGDINTFPNQKSHWKIYDEHHIAKRDSVDFTINKFVKNELFNISIRAILKSNITIMQLSSYSIKVFVTKCSSKIERNIYSKSP